MGARKRKQGQLPWVTHLPVSAKPAASAQPDRGFSNCHSCGSREDFGRAGGNEQDTSSPSALQIAVLYCPHASQEDRSPGATARQACSRPPLFWPVRLPQISLLGSESCRVFLAQRKIPLNSRNYNLHLLLHQIILFPSYRPQLLTQPQGTSIPKGDKPALLEKSPHHFAPA